MGDNKTKLIDCRPYLEEAVKLTLKLSKVMKSTSANKTRNALVYSEVGNNIAEIRKNLQKKLDEFKQSGKGSSYRMTAADISKILNPLISYNDAVKDNIYKQEVAPIMKKSSSLSNFTVSAYIEMYNIDNLSEMLNQGLDFSSEEAKTRRLAVKMLNAQLENDYNLAKFYQKAKQYCTKDVYVNAMNKLLSDQAFLSFAHDKCYLGVKASQRPYARSLVDLQLSNKLFEEYYSTKPRYILQDYKQFIQEYGFKSLKKDVQKTAGHIKLSVINGSKTYDDSLINLDETSKKNAKNKLEPAGKLRRSDTTIFSQKKSVVDIEGAEKIAENKERKKLRKMSEKEEINLREIFGPEENETPDGLVSSSPKIETPRIDIPDELTPKGNETPSGLPSVSKPKKKKEQPVDTNASRVGDTKKKDERLIDGSQYVHEILRLTKRMKSFDKKQYNNSPSYQALLNGDLKLRSKWVDSGDRFIGYVGNNTVLDFVEPMVKHYMNYQKDHVNQKRSYGSAQIERLKAATRVETLACMMKSGVVFDSTAGKRYMLACKLLNAEMIKKGNQGIKELCQPELFLSKLNEKINDKTFKKYVGNKTKSELDSLLVVNGEKFLKQYQKSAKQLTKEPETKLSI